MHVTRALLVALLVLLTGASPVEAWDGCTPKAGDVGFTAADHTRLVAHSYGSGSTAIVLVHQRDGTMCQWTSYARRLGKLGYRALTIDLRNYGDSQSRGYPANMRFGGDVVGAINYVRAQGAKKVFVLGASMGGSAAIDGAANARPAVNGVVSVSGAADLVDAIEAVKRLRVPSLFVAGAGDRDFATDAHRLYNASPAKDKKLDVVPGAYEHGTQLVAASGRIRGEIETFLRSH